MASVIYPDNEIEQEYINVIIGDIRYIFQMKEKQPGYFELHPYEIQPIIAKGNRFEGITAKT